MASSSVLVSQSKLVQRRDAERGGGTPDFPHKLGCGWHFFLSFHPVHRYYTLRGLYIMPSKFVARVYQLAE